MLDDGFYISAYAHVDKMSSELRITIRHDHCIALWKKEEDRIELLYYWELERITGLKHHHIAFADKKAFYEFLDMLLSKMNPPISTKDIKKIIGTPLSPEDNLIDFYEEDPDYTYHATAHLFTSLLMDSKKFYNEKILTFCVDAGSDPLIETNCDTKYNFYGIYSKKGQMQRFPIPSPGPYWVFMKNELKYEEGSLMALATASKSESLENFDIQEDEYLIIHEDDKRKAFSFVQGIIKRILGYGEKDAGVLFNFYDSAFTEYESKVSMIVKIIQRISIEIVDKTVNKVVKELEILPQETYFGLNGGYALNCPTNTFIQNKYGFKGQLIAPCVNDSGQALGMGLFYFYKHMPYVNFKLNHSYYGDGDDVENFLHKGEFNAYIESADKTLSHFVEDISCGPVVWFSGRGEMGPRALGDRSILADPRFELHRDKLNAVKGRQWWRPVAPIILEEELDNWYNDAFISTYMLNIFTVKEDKKADIPAVNHADFTSRIQTLNKKDNEILYRAMKNYYKVTGIPIIINTSLNDKGEPIVNTINEAFNFALRKGLKVIYVDGYRIELRNHDKYTFEQPLNRNDTLFAGTLNEYGLSADEYTLYYKKFRHLKLDPYQAEDVKKIKILYKKYSALFRMRGGGP
ncbi:carbamoyltransferase C-terminal domain-containing protein [Anaerocolumna sp. MB42-C2]|uniref:carbamoyltransferase C-terminal domain-containing protein n=1 Tax=Anaerocolumna sp. MB42-C2 TaxID=3070997 RepID=UPI0027E16208|nr:carbamoyltransferase C-terminal domain-containing protein [Anaerocolumna sp. MB42-C2]WMJ86456.1 carbamoyltransferase C-terminal domain-containing protein [Anaerocolumna sp. MB42-C2]